MKMFKELGKIIYNFIKPQHLNNPLLKMPKRVRNIIINKPYYQSMVYCI